LLRRKLKLLQSQLRRRRSSKRRQWRNQPRKRWRKRSPLMMRYLKSTTKFILTPLKMLHPMMEEVSLETIWKRLQKKREQKNKLRKKLKNANTLSTTPKKLASSNPTSQKWWKPKITKKVF
jgi:hypothetical protein